ncbi:LuxR C-terminal-related transcriptional regulator [Altererythrobacter sp. MF3-039]|uniref:LuxR C-terminal-related transcriptional regulator n=1 Tax=Altererythrobacter sp. MF3-039 TaxID=3252901 RepID=UPI00390CAE4A
MPRILICDDHEIVRQGLIESIGSVEGWEVVGEAANGLESIGKAKQLKPDLIILDSAMPFARGIEVFTEVKRWLPNLKVAVLTGFTSARLLADWLDVGIDGLFLKSGPSGELIGGLRTILAGGKFISRQAAEIVATATSTPNLTAREREVLSLVCDGNSNAAIAERLAISAKTVEKHRASLMSKLGVHSISDLMTYALREGLLDEHRQL